MQLASPRIVRSLRTCSSLQIPARGSIAPPVFLAQPRRSMKAACGAYHIESRS
jgi:hypothetical protein